MPDKEADLIQVLEQEELENIPKQYQPWIDTIGLEGAIALCKNFGGSAPYIPTLNTMQSFARKRHIQREYDGTNVTLLSRKYRVSTRWVQQILDEPMPASIMKRE